MKVKEVIYPPLFKIVKAQAITLYPFIFYKSKQAKLDYQAHEFIHVEQIRRLGWFKFYASYLNESRKKGYWNNKYEKEARGEH